MEAEYVGGHTVEVIHGGYFMTVLAKPSGGLQILAHGSYSSRYRAIPRDIWKQMLSCAGKELRRQRSPIIPAR
ncbi:MAG: hypothetical protein HY454_03445 [Parcubacteria group bacterium]|nr:hypothetical protein [Parcubacteria group bacterium]